LPPFEVVLSRQHRQGCGQCRASRRIPQGFTLLEIIAVLVLLGVLAVVAVPKYLSMQNDSRLQGARNMVASAQSQLSLDFSRRILSGLSLAVVSQEACNVVVSHGSGVTANLSCSGNLDGNVAITADIDGVQATGSWSSPVASGS
jgi:prepilin-type N-terminal cleavage/methylation domain-containing protein